MTIKSAKRYAWSADPRYMVKDQNPVGLPGDRLLMTDRQASTLTSLFNQAVRDDSKESRDELLAHWKMLCDFLDRVDPEEHHQR